MTVVAEVVRSGFVESVHHGRVVAVDGFTGRVLLSVGDVQAPMLPRSAAKPLQTIAMLRAGWSPADDEQVALACASHSGEPAHVDVVQRMLAAAGLDASCLDNTPDLPLDADAARAVLRTGGGPEPLLQNCSGKHAAMLATCVAAKWPTKGYRYPQHPLQLRIRAAVEELTGERVGTVAVDGCGAPAFAVSLTALANAFTRLSVEEPETAVRRVADSMTRHPFLVGGTGRDVGALLAAGYVVKDGAEGVLAGVTPDRVGIAVKIDDGGGRARTPVFVAALERLGYDTSAFPQLATTVVLGHGEPVGEVRAVLHPVE